MSASQQTESRNVLPTSNLMNDTKPPVLSTKHVAELCKELFDLNVLLVKELNSYDDRNFHVITSNDEQFLMKVTNSDDSSEQGLLEGQNEMMLFLHREGFQVPCPIDNTHGSNIIRKDFAFLNQNKEEQGNFLYAVRLFRFVTGIRLCEIEINSQLLQDCGEYLARLNISLKKFQNDSIRERKYLWSLNNVPQLRKYLNVIDEDGKKKILENCISQFESEVLSSVDKLEHCFIHGDFNEQNILVETDDTDGSVKLKAILDFGDISYSPRLYDIAILLTYIMLIDTTVDAITVAPNLVLRGYNKLIRLSQTDIRIIMICAKARLSQSLILGAYTYSLQPGNEYLLTTAKKGWQVLRSLCQMEQSYLASKWMEQVV